MAARFRLILIGCVALTALPALAVEPQPSATPVSWELSIQPAPLMRIAVGGKTYWYMIYTVTNNTGQDVDFNPEIVRVSEIDNETPAEKAAVNPSAAPSIKTEPAIVGVDTKLFKAISERHSKTYPFLVTPVKAIDRLLQGKDNARTSVAVFPDLDPRISHFTIYIGGLSGERIARNNPAYDAGRPADDKDNPRLFVLQKTLALPYTLPGDVQTRRSAEPALGKMGWVMR